MISYKFNQAKNRSIMAQSAEEVATNPDAPGSSPRPGSIIRLTSLH